MDYYEKVMPAPDCTECYASPGGEDLLAAVYRPASDSNGAAVLLVHGGGWRGGSREQFFWHAHRLSLRGYLACSIDYRLDRPGVVHAAIDDCRSAMAWLRSNAGKLGFEAERVGAVGSSAGGHLVACLGVSDGDGDVSARATCVVDVHGVHDFISLSQSGFHVAEDCEERIGGPLVDTRDAWTAASPLYGVDARTSPTLLIHDPDDEVVPYDQSVAFGNALMQAGRPMRFIPSPGSGHGFVYNPANEWTPRVWPAMVEWLDGCLLDAEPFS